MSRGQPPTRRGRASPAERRAAERTNATGSPDGDRDGQGWRRRELSDDFEALEIDPDIDDAELLEFLEADVTGSEADPDFKERLREKLWRIVRTRSWKSDDER
jgi:hypothetical protein